MAATIIQFPQTHSNIFLNLTQLINLASDNQVVEEYAEIMAVCHEEGNFKPGEVETPGKCKTGRKAGSNSRKAGAVLLHSGNGRTETKVPDRSRTELLWQTLPHQHSTGAERQRNQKRWCERGKEPQTELSVHGWMV